MSPSSAYERHGLKAPKRPKTAPADAAMKAEIRRLKAQLARQKHMMPSLATEAARANAQVSVDGTARRIRTLAGQVERAKATRRRRARAS